MAAPDGGDSSECSSSGVIEHASPGPPEADDACESTAAAITAPAVAALAAAMFKVGESGPLAPTPPWLAHKESKGLVQLAAAHMLREMPDESITALSQSYGNFDRIMGLGWLLPGALGLPPDENKVAYNVTSAG